MLKFLAFKSFAGLASHLGFNLDESNHSEVNQSFFAFFSGSSPTNRLHLTLSVKYACTIPVQASTVLALLSALLGTTQQCLRMQPVARTPSESDLLKLFDWLWSFAVQLHLHRTMLSPSSFLVIRLN